MKQFPKEIFVTVEGDPGEEFFDVNEKLDTTAIPGKTVSVAIYRLVTVGSVKADVHLDIKMGVKIQKPCKLKS
jgi:uncharacterized membrane protein (DUF441 family)